MVLARAQQLLNAGHPLEALHEVRLGARACTGRTGRAPARCGLARANGDVVVLAMGAREGIGPRIAADAPRAALPDLAERIVGECDARAAAAAVVVRVTRR